MPTVTAESYAVRSYHSRPAASQRALSKHTTTEIEDAFMARRDAVTAATADRPLARVAALLVSISKNNGYEGRDPKVMPDTLSSGFVADLLGLDVGSLAVMLVDLRKSGLVNRSPTSALQLTDIPALESLADAR
jgi:hypothetical protein